MEGGEGGGQKAVWFLVLTLFPHWCKISSSYLMSVPNYWTWTKTTPQKKWFFWSNPHKVEAMITSLTEMLELPNFVHMTAFTLWFKSPDKILLVSSTTEIMTSWPFFPKTFNLKRPWVAIFGDIIKIVTMFIRTILKDSGKVRRVRNYVSKWNLYLYLLT